uniref:Casein kinase 2 beta n=1 Tax=Macaca mulatta TaxID=9544 RepID=A0A1D5QZG1_MACMU
MKAHILVGVLVMVGFTVGKGKWGPGAGREEGVIEFRKGVERGHGYSGLSFAELRRMYLFLNSSGLLLLPQPGL